MIWELCMQKFGLEIHTRSQITYTLVQISFQNTNQLNQFSNHEINFQNTNQCPNTRNQYTNHKYS